MGTPDTLTPLLFWPRRLGEERYSVNGLVVWRLEGKLAGQKSDTVASGFCQAGTDMAALKELLRHADIQTTTNICTPTVSDDKWEAIQRAV